MSTATSKMRAWQLPAGCTSVERLELVELPKPSPGAGEVLVRVRATSLNYRDQAIARGKYFGSAIKVAGVPLSDGAGVVEAIGAGVRSLAAGDRVAGTFFQGWLDGPPPAAKGDVLGCPPAKGMLADYVTLPETGVVKLARSLTFEEAATLPCAGVTAWNALMTGVRPLERGQSVLLIGTGGVSLLALRIAKAAGARVVATSSSDAKLVTSGPLSPKGRSRMSTRSVKPSCVALSNSLIRPCPRRVKNSSLAIGRGPSVSPCSGKSSTRSTSDEKLSSRPPSLPMATTTSGCGTPAAERGSP